ncbi:MAG: lysophospholipid acyltransferase family protein [Alphaproteobacteria bacterium]
MKNIRYIVEAALVFILFSIFRMMPLDMASACGGWFARAIGPRMAASRKAYKNLALAFPDRDEGWMKHVTHEMWGNMGRTAAEYMHLRQIGRERVIVTHEHIFQEAVAAGQGAIFISAHMGNWEINAPTLHERYNIPLNLTYRAPNNPYADAMLSRTRSLNGRIKTFPKHRSSGKDIMQVLKDKGFVGILIDQKYNEGVAVPFFGTPAMTNPIFVKLAQKYKCPVIPVQNKRLKGARFESIVQPPLVLFDAVGEALPAEIVIAEAHAHLERWICENPGQWLWLHRRWPRPETPKRSQ